MWVEVTCLCLSKQDWTECLCYITVLYSECCTHSLYNTVKVLCKYSVVQCLYVDSVVQCLYVDSVVQCLYVHVTELYHECDCVYVFR